MTESASVPNGENTTGEAAGEPADRQEARPPVGPKIALNDQCVCHIEVGFDIGEIQAVLGQIPPAFLLVPDVPHCMPDSLFFR